ncbi:carbohydrate-binding protein [Stackebrandtia nassauensis]|uniref:carbohydrate-binding protein n=1 Tax=Stackebrandtia nassauensis TaxID=283811 RepID=UPI0001A3A175|nr:carbohydrate-binding protein [Stackebrandtia nassauensis]
MNLRRTLAALGAGALTVTAVVGASPSAWADSAPSHEDARASLVGKVDGGILSAMRAEFGLTTSEVYDRLASESVAAEVEDRAQKAFGGYYAGTWLADDATRLVVAVTDDAYVSEVDRLGAEAKVVKDSLADLNTAHIALDRLSHGKDVPDTVHGWYSDVKANTEVVVADSRAAGRDFARAAGLSASDVTVKVSRQQPQPFADIVGGSAYNINGSSRCSVGFSATHPSYGDGFLTAGHCGRTGASITGGTGQGGSFRYSQFPGTDYAWVEAGSGWTVAPRVNGSSAQVANGTEAAVGASVCRSGSTTGWHCGTISAKNQSVSYPQGTVSGMTRTTVCAEPGDSGGSYISGGSAQGMTSGGSGNCSSGGTTFFEPLTRAIANTGTTLTTTDGGPGDPGETTWKANTSYQVGAQVVYNGVSYRCRIAHTSYPGWEPPNTPALWERIG